MNPIPGRFVCSYFDYHEPYFSALVLGSIGGTADNLGVGHKNPTQPLPLLTYAVKRGSLGSDEVVGGARFSPNGRYVLFESSRVGLGINPAHLYVLDTKTDVVTTLPITIGYREVSWSPDGQYIACVEGGDANGEAYIQTGPSEMYMPLNLNVCNWRTGKTQLVVANDTLRGPFSWVAPHTLIYGILSPKAQNDLARQEEYEAFHEAQNEPSRPSAQQGKSSRKNSRTVAKPAHKTSRPSQTFTNLHQRVINPN